MELDNVVPWGRSYKEYKEMFSLSEKDLNLKILGCGDGPACFNAEATKSGSNVISVDPIYQFNRDEISSRIDHVYPRIMSQVAKNSKDFVWKQIVNVEELGNTRMRSMEIFLNDYGHGKEDGRYVNASLPVLPFVDKEYDLALCSHYLFLYSEQVNENLHIFAIKELFRVATEVRVYPLLALDGAESKHLHPVVEALKSLNVEVSFPPVKYEFQKGATKMLVVKSI